MIRVGDLVIDRDRYIATVGGSRIELTFMEFNVLWLIVSNNGRVVSYDALAETLWGGVVPRAPRRLAVLVSRTREKLGPEADLIETVKRVGYRLSPAYVVDDPPPDDAKPLEVARTAPRSTADGSV
ncbi:MAG: winged helix-turn-helix domain-containing protein [Dehalococcoidia bacterium]